MDEGWWSLTTLAAILDAIRSRGPLSAAEMASALQVPRSKVDSAVHAARKGGNRRVLRIASYRRNIGTGHGGREIPVYGLGPGEDAPRPEMGVRACREAKDRYRARMKARAIEHAHSPPPDPGNPYLHLIR